MTGHALGQPFDRDLVQLVEDVAHPVTLGPQVPDVLRVRLGPAAAPARRSRRPYPSSPARLAGLFVSSRMRTDTQVDEDLRAGAVVARVGRQAEVEVGVDRVAPRVLQLVGLQLVQQADPPALMPAHVEHDAAALARRRRQRGVQLRAAVAAQRAEHVAGQALRVHPDQHVLAVAEVAADQRECSASRSTAR